MHNLFALVFEHRLLCAIWGCSICPVHFTGITLALAVPPGIIFPCGCSSWELWAALCSFSAPNVHKNWRLPGALSL